MKSQRLRFSKLPFLPKIYTESKKGIIDQDNGVKVDIFKLVDFFENDYF